MSSGPSGPVIWAGEDPFPGLALGERNVDVTKVGNRSLNGSEEVAFVQLVGEKGSTKLDTVKPLYSSHAL